MTQKDATFPTYHGVRCLMMPYIQGDPSSVPPVYSGYAGIIETLTLQPGEIGYLTIDESPAKRGRPHRGARAKYDRALHTEAGLLQGDAVWGGPYWGGRPNVRLDPDTEILISSNSTGTCAVWSNDHHETTEDGDIGHVAHHYPYADAHVLDAGEVARIGIFTPHESLPVTDDHNRQFLRIVGMGVTGREPYFTKGLV